MSDTIGYLSAAWFRELAREVAESDELAKLAGEHTIRVTEVVTGGPEGDVTFHLVVGDGAAAFGLGPAEPDDVRMEQSWATAVDVATGALNAQQAFITGEIRLVGDPTRLADAQPVFAALDAVFAAVRQHTRYEQVGPMPEVPHA